MKATTRLNLFAVLIFAVVFGGSVVCATEIFGWQDGNPLLFGGAVTLALMVAVYLWVMLREGKYAYACRRHSRASQFISEADPAQDSPDWFNRN